MTPRPMPRSLALVLLLGLAACGAREIPREDWGAITPDAEIRVTTADGEDHDLTRVRVLTDALHGMRTSDSRQVRFPLDSVEAVEAKGGPAVWPVLTAIAAVAATIWIVQASGESDVAPPPTEVGSCPFIYSFDGTGWHLDSETYAGAVVQALKRTDLDNLEHLQPVDGTYRLRLANERPESQYTDELTLLVVDHPEGTEVFSDVTGRPRVVADAARPTTATGLRGADVLDAVLEADGSFWSGDPIYTIDTEDPSSFRDGMELTFPRSEGDAGLLTVRAQNTVLAPFVLEKFLQLLGDDLVPWYRQVDDDPELQSDLRSWIVREGTLHVSVWIDGGWERQDILLDVGPHLPKAQVARLDLSEVEGDEVRVRLEGPRGLWTIDHVSLGSDAGAEPVVHHLTPTVAAGPDGRDVRGELAAADERYFTALTGDDVELTFQAPPPPPDGRTRTIMARTSGFYHIWVERSGPARLDLVRRILEEPLFVNRYMLSLFLETELQQ